MPYDVDTLQIEIGASSKEAASQVRELAQELKNLKSAMAGKWKNPIKEMTDSKAANTDSSKSESADSQEAQAKRTVSLWQRLRTRLRLKIDSSDADKAEKKVTLLSKALNALKRVAFYRVIRSAIKAIGDAIREGTENAYQYSAAIGGNIGYVAEAFDQMANKSFTMKNQMGAAWATLKAAIIPILVEIVQWATQAANAITQLFAALSGKSVYMKAVDTSKKWADNTAKGAAAAKAWRNQLMGFDEINRLEEPSTGGGGGGGVSGPDYSQMFETLPVSKKLQDIVAIVKNHLKELKALAIGAEIGIGLALLLTGANVPLGLAILAKGLYDAYGYLKVNWSYLTDSIGNALGAISMLLIGAEVGIGLIFALSGANVPLGLALIASGLFLGANQIALSWDDLPNKIKMVVSAIDLVVASAFLTLGCLFAFTGANLPLGIALMIAGIGSGVAGIKLMWDSVPNKLDRVVKIITAIVSGALLAIGALIMFGAPAFSPLGLGLIIAGVVGMVASAAINWEWAVAAVKSVFSTLLAIISGMAIVLGVLLCLSGAGLGLGLAIIAAGLAGSYAAWSISSNPITNFVKGVANAVIGILNSAVVGIESLINGILDGIGNALSVINSFSKLVGINISWRPGHVNLPKIRGFATGGFPEDGLFFANHNELIGRFQGGKTVVANNEQIVAGITYGVEEGNEGVIGVLYQILSVAQEINQNRGNGYDITELTREVTRKQSRQARASGI